MANQFVLRGTAMPAEMFYWIASITCTAMGDFVQMPGLIGKTVDIMIQSFLQTFRGCLDTSGIRWRGDTKNKIYPNNTKIYPFCIPGLRNAYENTHLRLKRWWTLYLMPHYSQAAITFRAGFPSRNKIYSRYVNISPVEIDNSMLRMKYKPKE